MYLLDTNACIRLLRGDSPTLSARLRMRQPWEVLLCSVVKAELYHGARRSSRVAENLSLLGRFFATFSSVAFDDRSAEQYGFIRADLERAGSVIGPNDLMIASIARAHDIVLVTNNRREFSRIVGLQIEDWEEPAGPPP